MKMVKADLLLYILHTPNDFVVHCISNDWALGKGIARSLDCKYHIKSKPRDITKVGECYIDNYNGINIANLITKEKYWQKPTYETLKMSLYNLREKIPFGSKLVMPKIGCGLDKLDWNEVKDIIKIYLKEYDVTVYYLD